MTRTCIFFLLACLQATLLFSQDSTIVQPLDEVVVTANRYPKKAGETGKVITVLNSRYLEDNQGRNMGDILQSVAGIQIPGAANTLGETQTITMRGAPAGNVLILVDGLPVNDPSVLYNYFDLNFIPVALVERIEILKGGHSTLYGSDAVSGVINIITKKPEQQGLQGNLNISAGSYGTWKGDISMRGKSKKSSYSLQYGLVRSAGFSSATDTTKQQHFDNDGFDQHLLSGMFQTALREKLQLRISGRLSRYEAGVDERAFTDDRDSRAGNTLYQGSAGLTYTLPRGTISLNYQHNRIRRTYLNDSAHRGSSSYYTDSKFSGITHFAEVVAAHQWTHAELLYGVDFRQHRMEEDGYFLSDFGPYQSSISGDLAHTRQFSGFSTLVLKNNKGFSTELGGRWNHHSNYGNNFTFNLNPSVLLHQKLKLFSNLYSAYKTPTLYQLFAPFYGFQDLLPERSTIAEAGFSLHPTKGIMVSATYFHRHTRDAIHYIVLNPSTFESGYRNVRQQQSYGVETGVQVNMGIVEFSANYTYTDGKTRSGYDETGTQLNKDTVYNNLYRIARNRTNVVLGIRPTAKLYVNATLLLNGRRQEPINGARPVDLAAYQTLDVHGSYRLRNNLNVYADLRNITNAQYADILGYNTRGFNFTVGLMLNFRKS